EATAAAIGQAAIRRDPFAMLPFIGYHMADYWKHWLDFRRKKGGLPRIFRVDRFRKDGAGKLLWPGCGQNMRAIEWILGRVQGRAGAVESPLGHMPCHSDMCWEGLDYSPQAFAELMSIRREGVRAEAAELKEYFGKFGSRLPPEMERQRALLEKS